ncbi:MAG: hypothetical protein ACJAVV_001200 [Alphaproteobacteria bacterium]|jgi:hypothetical protein
MKSLNITSSRLRYSKKSFTNFAKTILAAAFCFAIAPASNAASELISASDKNKNTSVVLGGYAKIDVRHVNGDIAYQDYWVAKVCSRVFIEFKTLLTDVTLSFSSILGEAGISAGFLTLYLPVGILIVCALVAAFLQTRKSTVALSKAFNDSSKTILGAGFVLLFTIPMVRIFFNSGVNLSDIPSMPVSSAEFFANVFGVGFPMISATIGALGAFIAGSNTVSNMMFSQF